MLGKLMKHEFRATARLMVPLLAAVLALSVFSRIADSVITSHALYAIRNLLSTLFAFGLFAAVIASVVLTASRFHKNLMTDEGYLMFTLPVSVHGLLWSKLLVSIVWFIAVFAVDALALLISFGSDVTSFTLGFNFGTFEGNFREFFTIVNDISKHQFGVPILVFGAELLGLGLLALVTGCLLFYAPISIGNSFAGHKTLLSVVFFFVIQFAFQIGSIWLIASGTMTGATMRAQNPAQYVILIVFLTLLLFAAILYCITWLMLRLKRNLQ